LEAVDLAIHDDPLARQSAIAAAGDAAVSKGRSSGGRAGTTVVKGKSKRRG
jgi:excinuclease ABC subunit B